MGSERYPLHQDGIYRNLPTFDPAIKGLSAIVCGASGVSGFNAIRALLSTPDRWSTVYTISRHPLNDRALRFFSDEQLSRIKQICIDLTSSAAEVAANLQDSNVKADYAFFYSYTSSLKSGKSAMSPDAAQELADANVPLLQNFLEALPLASIRLRRILLQTGGKHYGAHIGRVRTPCVESDPQPEHLGPNFYYPQEGILFEYCTTHPETSWNIIRPQAIIGAAPNASLDFFSPFAIYASVQQHKGEPLHFGGDFDSWQFEATHSTARLTGYLSEWTVLEDKCANQVFNAQDGSPLSWDRFFGELARWYGVEKGIVGPVEDEGKYMTITLAGGKNAPLGYGPPLTMRLSFSMGHWATGIANRKAWEEIMQQSHLELTQNQLESDPSKMAVGEFGYLRFGTLSINKARRFGFTGYVDTLESVFEMYRESAEMGTLPRMKVDAARPMI